MKGAALFVFFCVCAHAQPGTIDGVAVHSVTGQPVGGVHVRLMSGSFDGVREAYGAISNSAGRFSIAAIPSGTYILTAERTGFVYVRKTPANGPSASLALKAGERLTELKLELAPRSIVAGRVVDEFGDPVAGVSVILEAISKESSLGMGMVGSMFGTDDRGEFRLRAGPGKYRLRATPHQGYMYMSPEAEGRGDGTQRPVYGPTYFPGTANRDQASVIETTPGSEVNGLEIRLARRSGFTISGTVTGLPENGFASVMLQSGDNPRRINRTSGRGIQRDGKFTFAMMEAAYYRIFAFLPTGRPPLQSQAVEFKLDGDVTNLQLALAPGGEITGTLEFAGGGVPVEKRTVRLKSDIQFFGRVPSGEVDKEGTFRISNVLPDRVRVQVDPLPDNAYVKTVQLDGTTVQDGQLDFSSGAHNAKLKITIGRNGGQVTGGVVEKDGQHLNSPVTLVYLVQDPDEARYDRSARLNPEGKFSFKALRPGKYRLFAVDPLRGGTGGTGEDRMKDLFAKADEIEIKEGDRITLDAKVLTQEESRGAQ